METIPPMQGSINYCQGCGYTDNPSYACFVNELDEISCTLPDFGVCLKDEIANLNENYGTGDSLPANSLAYEICDSGLVRFSKGRDYITYYYLISQEASESNCINATNFIQHFNFAKDVFEVAQIFLNGDDLDVPISISFKNDALSLLAFYRNVESAEYFQDILDIIEADINNYVGKNNAYIKNELFN